MTTQLSSTKRILALTAIFASTIIVMADLAITPVIGMIYGYYPNNMGAVNFIVSGPMLIVVIVSLLTPTLFRFLDKKTVFILAAVIFSIGAIGGVIVDNPLYICFTRALVGIGEGAANVVGVAYIADLYESPDDRSRITGFYNAGMSLAGMLLSYIAGLLASNGVWLNVYKIYWVSIPIVILIILFVPSVKPTVSSSAETSSSNQPKEKMGWRFWFMNGCWFIMNIVLGASILYYLSSYIFEFNLGDSSFSGLATAIKSVCGILIGMVYGQIVGKCKRFTPTVTYITAIVTMVLMLLIPSRFSALVLGTICGLTYKVEFSYGYGHGFAIVPPSRTDEAVSITTAVYGLGSFLCTYFATWIMGIFHTDSIIPVWYVCAAVIGVVLIADLIAISIEKKQFPQE